MIQTDRSVERVRDTEHFWDAKISKLSKQGTKLSKTFAKPLSTEGLKLKNRAYFFP